MDAKAPDPHAQYKAGEYIRIENTPNQEKRTPLQKRWKKPQQASHGSQRPGDILLLRPPKTALKPYLIAEPRYLRQHEKAVKGNSFTLNQHKKKFQTELPL